MRKFLAIISLFMLGGCCSIYEGFCCQTFTIMGDDVGRLTSINRWYVHDMRMACESALESDMFRESECARTLRYIVEYKSKVEPYARKKGTFSRIGPLYDFEQCMNNGMPITDETLKQMARDMVERAKSEKQKEVCEPLLFGGSYFGKMYNCPDITKLGN